MPPASRPKIAILGAGIAGLTAAYRLAQAGNEVVLLESSEKLGGLGTYFEWRGQWLDQFYHCQMPSDEDLLQLIQDIGLKPAMYWKPTRMGFIVRGRRYAFNKALDLLRFSPLSFPERIRFGVISLMLRKLGEGKDLDRMKIETWLTKLYGAAIWKKLLKPLFVSKFGPAAGNMPALYIWERLGREKNAVSRGYLRGGLKAFLDRMEERLVSLGVEIRKNAAVERLDETQSGVVIDLKGGGQVEADWCISTLPIPILREITEHTCVQEKLTLPELTYQGVVNALFLLKRPLDNYYWAPVMESGTEFDGVVEMTELVDPAHYGGHFAAYVMKYCDRHGALFNQPEEQIAARWKAQLVALYPDLGLTGADVVDVKVFKAPFVEPAYPLGYSDLKPRVNEGNSRVYLATSAQVYPRITAWNSSVWLANQVVRQLRERLGFSPKPADQAEEALV